MTYFKKLPKLGNIKSGTAKVHYLVPKRNKSWYFSAEWLWPFLNSKCVFSKGKFGNLFKWSNSINWQRLHLVFRLFSPFERWPEKKVEKMMVKLCTIQLKSYTFKSFVQPLSSSTRIYSKKNHSNQSFWKFMFMWHFVDHLRVLG